MTRVSLFGIAAALAAAMSPQGSLTAEAEQTSKRSKSRKEVFRRAPADSRS
jgi:hypothetical protein